MKITLKEHNAHNIKRARHAMRVSSLRQSLTLRNGSLYTMRYNPGRQPRTESQEKSWSLFAEANRLATADFHNPSRKAYWQQQLKLQSRYKTARGLAKAHYIRVLKLRMSRLKQNISASTRLAVQHLRPACPAPASPAVSPSASAHLSWGHYRNVLWFRHALRQPQSPDVVRRSS